MKNSTIKNKNSTELAQWANRSPFCEGAKNGLITFLILVCTLFSGFNSVAQAPGCPNVDAGPDIVIPCDEECTILSADYLRTGETWTYDVTPIQFAPPFPATGGTSVSVNIDDRWSDAIDLPFDFCFYGQDYDQMLVGSNGVVTFDLNSNTPGGFCAWSFDESLPSPDLFSATIFGPYMDIDPSVEGSGDINWAVFGAAPCRTMVVNYPAIPYFSSACNDITMTTQIVIYETTNVVEVYLTNRSDQCPTWNDGNAVLGIQNQGGTAATVAPGRNTGNWAANTEAWRFTPSGAPNVVFTWLNGAGDPISNSPVLEVCPEDEETVYTAQAVYTNCNGDVITVQDEVTVTQLEGDSVDYHYENEDHVDQTEFCIGEDVYVNGSATLDTANFFMDLWIVGSDGEYDWISGAGWMPGTPDFVNITELFENDPENPVVFQVGETYSVKLAINDPECGWVSLQKDFTIIDCCDEFTEADFFLNPEPGSDYSIVVQDYEDYGFINGVHEWYVLSSPNQGTGPYTPVFSTTTTGPGPVMLIDDAQFGLYYTVVHKVITDCGEICYAQEQFQQEGRGKGGSGYTRAIEIDCCFVFDYWPNGPGEPITFTAEFDIGLDLDGNIITGNFFEYENEPSTVHEWYLFTSPNPDGGPYTLIDHQTGVEYTYGPIDDEIYYFLIHRVTTDCGEVCYGQSICRNCNPLRGACELCMEIDCSILDDIIPDCENLPAPTNLMVDGDTLTWDPVPGAVSYIVSSPGGTDPQIACNCELPISILPIETNTNSLVLPEGLQSQCFVWMVTAICFDGTRSDPSNQECFIPIRGSRESNTESSQIAPNPNNGNMNFVVQTSYDSEVTVEVYDFYGKLIQTFESKLEAHSPSTISWDAAGQLARGIYFVTFKTDKNTWSKKVIVD